VRPLIQSAKIEATENGRPELSSTKTRRSTLWQPYVCHSTLSVSARCV